MNIKITHNWLLDYLETDSTPLEIQKYLSLSGPSVERVDQADGDYVYDIEITTNRIDMAGVFGIAQEAQAILPQFGKKARLKQNPLEEYKFANLSSVETRHGVSLQIKITNPNLCSRFTTIVLSNIKIGESPDFIKKRLMLCGIKSINNVVDISNYLMVALGQPTHIFDYDKIGGVTMIMREAKKGEKVTTLDKKEITLPGGDIVIEDGEGKLIDLCGIMGGLNSSVTSETKNVLLFVQTYNKHKIRRTSMLTGQRSVAATYFEKGLDPERVEPTLVYGVKLLEKYASGKINSLLFDIYKNPYKTKTIEVNQEDINRIIGVEIEKKTIISILERLGFLVETRHGVSQQYNITVPSFRANDVSIKEDIIEEVARVYGYYNLPDNIQPSIYIPQPEKLKRFYTYQQKIKYFLKHLGLNEIQNYSMISKKQIEDLHEKPGEYLRLSNSISEELEYLRKSLYPSLIKNIKDNTGKKSTLKFFEIAKIYLPQKEELPNELYKLGLAFSTSYLDLKGIIEALLKELNVSDFYFKQSDYYLLSNLQSELFIGEKSCGFLGELDNHVYLAEMDFTTLIEKAQLIANYKPINPYAVIKLDWTTDATAEKTYAEIQKKAFLTSKLLENIEVISVYQNRITLRLYFSSNKENITETQAKQELEEIKTAFE